jgi:hypothetical protein
VKIKLLSPSSLICFALVTSALLLRISFLRALTNDPNSLNFGGDACHHYNIAWNVAHGRGPFTDFIFAYWFHHPALPALTDIYPPGVHYVLAIFLNLLGDNYGSARLASLFFGSIAGCIVYLLARQFTGRGLSFVAASILVLNPVHIEHSTVVMTPVIASFFVWMTVLIFLKYRGGFVWKGALAGWSHLCMSALVPLSLGFVLSEWLRRNKEPASKRGFCRGVAMFVLGIIICLGPWAVQTYRYFGKVFYTNFAFYPFTQSWVPMNYETTPPSLVAFIQSSGGVTGVTKIYAMQFFAGLRRVYFQALPLSTPDYAWVTPLSVVFVALGIIRLCRRETIDRAVLFLICFLSFLLMLSIGSTANGGVLFTRHVIVFIPFVAILWVLGVELLAVQLKKLALSVNPRLERYSGAVRSMALSAGMVVLAATSWTWISYFRHWTPYNMAGARETPFSEIYAFRAFWMEQHPELEEAARWVVANTSPNAVFMYGSTPQDFWALTHRRVVIDPVYAGGSPVRARAEAIFYNVDFLVLDSTATIYPRSPHPTDLAQSYPGLRLSRVWVNGSGSIDIYKIEL